MSKRFSLRKILFSIILVSFAGSSLSIAESGELGTLYKKSWDEHFFYQNNNNEIKNAYFLFFDLFSTNSFTKNDIRAFELYSINENGEDFFVLTEREGNREGRGFYIIRKDPTARNLLMIPHRRYDKYTGEIGLKIFLNSNLKCIAWNTTSRFGSEDHLQDLAKVEESVFNAFAEAFVKVNPNQFVFQLHGYSVEKRKTESGSNSECILSNGTRHLTRPLETLSEALKQVMGYHTKVYPEEVSELGATTNITGKRLRDIGFYGFVHIELNFDIRKRLNRSPEELLLFSKCIMSL